MRTLQSQSCTQEPRAYFALEISFLQEVLLNQLRMKQQAGNCSRRRSYAQAYITASKLTAISSK
ncbi:hypothetical protein X956_10210 [Trueperella pyogenes TP8]|nr:hypothetical protein X956_10210 [Trueperella pyogenes TP8]